MTNNHYDEKKLIALYVEIIAIASFSGLIFPAIFFGFNLNNIDNAIITFIISVTLIPIASMMFVILKGEIFPNLFTSLKQVRVVLYIWAIILLLLVSFIIYQTGGLQSSIFIWLFEFGLIVAILVRPYYEEHFWKHWRPVITIAIMELFVILFLVLLGSKMGSIPSEIKKTMPIWGGMSAFFSLAVSFLLFYMSFRKK